MNEHTHHKQGHALMEVLVAILLSSIVVTLFFSLDTGIKRTLVSKMNTSQDYASITVLRERLAADIRRCNRYVQRSDSLLELLLVQGNTIRYNVWDGKVYRNGIEFNAGGFEARKLDIIYSNTNWGGEQSVRFDSLLTVTLVHPNLDACELRLQLKPVEDFRIYRR